jgi:hypothetical protein
MIEPKVEITEFLAVLDKAETGPMVDVKEWDQLYIYQTIQDLIYKYDIALDIEDPGVPSDDALADRVFEAAMDLAVRSGVYCMDTQRRMIWTQDELDNVLARVPEEVEIGEGDGTRECPRCLYRTGRSWWSGRKGWSSRSYPRDCG